MAERMQRCVILLVEMMKQDTARPYQFYWYIQAVFLFLSLKY